MNKDFVSKPHKVSLSILNSENLSYLFNILYNIQRVFGLFNPSVTVLHEKGSPVPQCKFFSIFIIIKNSLIIWKYIWKSF